jgi:hypothetical protein
LLSESKFVADSHRHAALTPPMYRLVYCRLFLDELKVLEHLEALRRWGCMLAVRALEVCRGGGGGFGWFVWRVEGEG